jgi:DNA-binding IclR family transcriptional regulator
MLGSLALVRRARPILRELRQTTARTVSLAILDGADVLYLQRLCGFAQGQYELEKGLGAGTRRPARSTAAGQALLAGAGEPARQPQTNDGDGLVALEGGLLADARGLAIAIQTPGERPYAIELTVPAEAISAADATRELGDALQAAATALRRMHTGDRPNQCVAS